MARKCKEAEEGREINGYKKVRNVFLPGRKTREGGESGRM